MAELPLEELAEGYDPETWYEAEDGTDYCCREVWDGADDGRCIWHADVADKPAEALAAARSEEPARLDRAVLRESDLSDRVSLSECRLREADLGGAHLTYADLGGADLTYADLGGAGLREADLGGANLHRADFGGANLKSADLGGADLRDADLGGANLFAADLGDADLGDADLGGADLRRADLGGADLKDADLSGAHLGKADPGDAHSLGADLCGADLRGADLSGAHLGETDLSEAYLGEANLGEIYLRGADLHEAGLYDADLGDADLGGAYFGDAYLGDADLGGADLRDADLGGADLRDADLGGADLRDADLGEAALQGADLTASKLRQTTFEDATFDESTTFGASSGYETEADAAAEDASWLASHVSSRLRGLGRPSTDPELLEWAETQYRTVQRLKREHDLKQDPALEIQEKHVRRKRALAERRYWDWFKLAVYRWPMGYGEKPGHVVGTSLVVIGISALVYPLFGLSVGKENVSVPADTVSYLGAPHLPLYELGKSLYFSVITFTTLGYGDLQPVGLAEAVATLESFLGALLMALLVFVLGRRATW